MSARRLARRTARTLAAIASALVFVAFASGWVALGDPAASTEEQR